MSDTREGSLIQSQMPVWIATWTARQANVADSTTVQCAQPMEQPAGKALAVGLLVILWIAFVWLLITEDA
jgi:hypothetical protein